MSQKQSPNDRNAVQMLQQDGTLRDGVESPLNDQEIQDAFRWMLLSRTFDKRATSMQRQGRMGTFSAVSRQEASVVGSALALDVDRDWIAPQYREMLALIRHGFQLERYFLYWIGNPAGVQMAKSVRVLPIQIAVAAQLPHAVGLAWGLRLQGLDGVVLAYFGDAASSEGDAHEAMNFAGVLNAPVVLFLQNCSRQGNDDRETRRGR